MVPNTQSDASELPAEDFFTSGLLPEEVLEEVLEYLDGSSLLQLGFTCSYLAATVAQPRLWFRILRLAMMERKEVERLVAFCNTALPSESSRLLSSLQEAICSRLPACQEDSVMVTSS